MSITPSASDTECEDCGISFPLRKNTGSICLKCTKLAQGTYNSIEYKEIQLWLQCIMCSITRRNMVASPQGQKQLCGASACQSALGVAPLHSGLTDEDHNSRNPSQAVNTAPETYQQRAIATRDRLKAFNQSRNLQPGTQLTTSILQSHEHGGGAPGEAKIFIGWQVRNGKKPKQLDAALGGQAKKWAASVYMTDIKSDIVMTVNLEWVRSYGSPLLPEDTTLRWSGNRIFEPNTATLSLGEFYDYYSAPNRITLFFPTDPPPFFKSLKKSKTPLICLELWIDYEMWKRRTNPDHDGNLDSENTASFMQSTMRSVVKRKRSYAQSIIEKEPVRNKHRSNGLGLGNIPISQFRMSSREGPSIIHQQSEVILKKTICVTDATSGECKLVDTGSIVRGHILDMPFCNGSMKNAYNFYVANGEQLVVKRFFRLSDESTDQSNPSEISVDNNRVQIEGEIIRLSLGKWFLEAFYKFCEYKAPQVAVDQSIVFAEAFLGQETEAFSIASGVSPMAFEGLTWLVEQKRPTTVIKFSGTLMHRTQKKDHQSQTIYAFAHFVYGFSHKQMVMADIQGTPTQVKGRDSLVLFDTMTHTFDGNSGIGDFGRKGILKFIEDHQCGPMCLALGLEQAFPLNPETYIEDDTGNARGSQGDSSEETRNQDSPSDYGDNDQEFESLYKPSLDKH